VQYILKYSLAKTLALKRRVSITRVMKARDIGVRVTNKNGQSSGMPSRTALKLTSSE
jgi:hypothetical protein